MTNQIKEEEDRAKEQALSQYESIDEMLSNIEKAEGTPEEDTLRDELTQDALEVLVRSDWHSPGAESDQVATDYKILLCTGGPAVQIVGELDQHGQPETAQLQFQDWYTPWKDYPISLKQEKRLLDYANYYYFVE